MALSRIVAHGFWGKRIVLLLAYAFFRLLINLYIPGCVIETQSNINSYLNTIIGYRRKRLISNMIKFLILLNVCT